MSYPSPPPSLREQYQLRDGLWADSGQVYLSGTQALVRLALMQAHRDRGRGWKTRGFISGYRGSPLGMLDQAIWKAGPGIADAGIEFVPAINEELAATQVLGTQRVESDPQKLCDAVFGLWYGKGPGVDRAGDALKHGNAYGSSPRGGVLVVAGDDHGCVSSSMPHQSDQAFMAWGMPVLQPASIAEFLEFGLFAYELSRFSGAWVGMAALSEVVESAGTVDLDLVARRVASWLPADQVGERTAYRMPEDGLHYRWPDLPSLRIESRLADKLEAVRAFSRVNTIDRLIVDSPAAKVGIITCGKAHADLMEVLRRLEIKPEMLAAAGVRVYKVGLSFPLEMTRLSDVVDGLHEVMVIEEKGAVVENQLRSLLYNAAQHLRPVIVGKHDAAGAPLLSALGELRPSRLIETVAAWLLRHFPDNNTFNDHTRHVRDFTLPALLGNDSDSVKRVPYFCAGCPHNTSTRVPEGSTARAGIGCHFMANWMERSTAGLIQMGGEGVDWVSHSRFTATPHVFQNLGDGTYFHSGYLAIRQAVAAKARMTYKILYNDAVAMTGGQAIDGVISVDAIARQVESEGVRQVVVLSDEIGKYRSQRQRFPSGTRFLDRSALDEVQRELRDIDGVTVLIYEQTCAAEKRRRRKKGELVDPEQRLFINEAVCEACGDCTVQSNCVAILPHETALGRKRRIDQTSCNKDYSCAQGFCPSFVAVKGTRLRKRSGALASGSQRFEASVAALPEPAPHAWDGPYDLLVTGVGGTGVVTVGAVVAMAAHLERKCASVLDFMGFAQKGGSVLSYVRLADIPERLHQVRIDAQQADAMLACDVVVGASPEALQTVRRDRTRILANLHAVPVAESLQNPDAELKIPLLLDKLRFAAGPAQVETFDAQTLAEAFLGDTVCANILALGYAWQRGLVPLSQASLLMAIRLNGVAVTSNLQAFQLGRLAAHAPEDCSGLLETRAEEDTPEHPEAMLDRASRQLTAYQNASWAQRYQVTMAGVVARDQALQAEGQLTRVVARNLLKLMTYKDEYEVARLYSGPSFREALDHQFEAGARLEYFMAPPLISRRRKGRAVRKVRFGSWFGPVLRVLAHGKVLRGSILDVFGYQADRREERRLIEHYEALILQILPLLEKDNLQAGLEVLRVPEAIRGFGHVKEASLRLAARLEAERLYRFCPSRYARPADPAVPQAGMFRGVEVVRAR